MNPVQRRNNMRNKMEEGVFLSFACRITAERSTGAGGELLARYCLQTTPNKIQPTSNHLTTCSILCK